MGLVWVISSSAGGDATEVAVRPERTAEFSQSLQTRALAKARRLERRGRFSEGVAVLELALEQLDDEALRADLLAGRARLRASNLREREAAETELWLPASRPSPAPQPRPRPSVRPAAPPPAPERSPKPAVVPQTKRSERELEEAGYRRLGNSWIRLERRPSGGHAVVEPAPVCARREPAEEPCDPEDSEHDPDLSWAEGVWDAFRDVRYGKSPQAGLIQLRRAWKSATVTQRRRMAGHILVLLEDGRWADREFARWALEDATGEALDAAGYRSWVACYLTLRRVHEPLRASEVDAVLTTLSASPPGPLLDLALHATEREGLLGAVPVLVEALDRVQPADLRQRMQTLLRRLTGADPGADLDHQASVASWSAWVGANAIELERKILVGELVAGGERAAAVNPQLRQQGTQIVPQLLEAYAEHPELVRVHDALRAVTGLEVDPSPEAWRAAWGAQ